MKIQLPLGLSLDIKKDNPIQKTKITSDYNKVFVIGLGKTGTTSLKSLLGNFDFTVGNQAVAEILAEDYAIHNRTDRLVKYVDTAEAFQDTPFFYTGMFEILDREFPDSKFILSQRNNADQWYESMLKYHTKKFSSDKERLPNEHDLKNCSYRHKGWLLETMRFEWDYPNVPLYDEYYYKTKYDKHIENVNSYFSKRKEQLVNINVAHEPDFKKLCKFLNVETNIKGFSWENRT